MRPIGLLLLCPALAAAQAIPPAVDPADTALAAARRAAEAAGRRTTRLFGDQTPLSFTLTADFTTVFKDRDTLSTKRYPATLTVADSTGAPRTFPLEIAPRGHWRLKATNCPFPPIKMNLEDGTARGTPFQGQGGIKLGTHCRPGNREYEEYVLREHLVYRTYNLLTDVSLRTRLARVIYVWEKASNPRADTAWALLIEDEDDAARRALGRIAELKRARFDDVDRAQMGLIGVFSYFTGNTDWSLYALHNLRIIQTVRQEVVPMAYDFDFSGIVNTRYATTDPKLPIKKVTERLYLGPCFSAAELETIVALFREKRPAIEALYSLQGLDVGYAKWAREYVAGFYSSVADARGVKRSLIDSCVQDSR